MGKFLSWQIGNGECIHLGLDPIVGLGSTFVFPEDLRSYLADLDICTLAHARNPCSSEPQYWYSSSDLDLAGSYSLIWDDYIKELSALGIRLNDNPDKLAWTFNRSSIDITAKEAYNCIYQSSMDGDNMADCPPVWNKSLPLKISCFIWLAYHNRILTWDNLQRRGLSGPGICSLCYTNLETVNHLFSCCWVWKLVAGSIMDYFNIKACLSDNSFVDLIIGWNDTIPQSSPLYTLLFKAIWMIWKARNQQIFEGKHRDILSIIHHILRSAISSMKGTVSKRKCCRIIGPPPGKLFPCGFMDGASQEGFAGAGIVIFISDTHFLEISLGVRHGTNTKAELLSL